MPFPSIPARHSAFSLAMLLVAGAAALTGSSVQGCFLDPIDTSTEPDAAPDVLAPAICTGTVADCDKLATNGCEVDLDADPDHCGACDTVCEGGGCNAGQCAMAPEIVVSGLLNPMRLLIAFDSFYFTTAGVVDPVADVQFGSIMRAGLEETEPTELAREQLGPDGLAVDDNFVYWTNAGGGTLSRMTRDGGEPVTIVYGQHSPRALALDADHLYWTSSIDRVVMRCALDGTGVTKIWQGPDAVLSIALSSSSVLFGTSTAVMMAPKANSESIAIASGQRNALGVAADGDNVFWLTQGRTGVSQDGSVRTITLAAAQASELAVRQGGPVSIALDEQFVYWTNYSSGTVMRVSRSGGKAVMLASHQAQPWGLALGPDGVYWTSMQGGEIRKVAK